VFRPGPGQRPGRHLPGAAGHLAGEPGRAGPGQVVLLPAPPAAQAGRVAARCYIMTARAAGAAVKAETKVAGAVMLPPGTAARSPAAVVSLRRDDRQPDEDHRWRRLLSCSSRHATAPAGSLGSSLGLATAGPYGST